MYEEQIPTAQLVQRVATVMQEYTQSGGVRPFGVSLLIAGWDDTGTFHQLFSVTQTHDLDLGILIVQPLGLCQISHIDTWYIIPPKV